MSSLDRRLESDYTVAELVRAVVEVSDYLGELHSSYGCAGCKVCTYRTMLDLAADGLEELADVLEAAEHKPVIDREALAKFIRDDAAYNYATILSDGEALALAEDILRFMSIEDKREVQAEALEAAADELTPGEDKVDDWGIQAGLLRARAVEIREGRA